jgi:hypothetical protein
MDQNALVEGGRDGLVAVADALCGAGFPVRAIYLVKRTGEDGYPDWSITAVLSPFAPGMEVELVEAYVRLRRAGRLPHIDRSVRVNGVSLEHVEASRVIEYARRLGEPPVVIRDAMWDGLYIDYALVAEFEPSTAAAA